MARPLPNKPYRAGLTWRIAIHSSARSPKNKPNHGLMLSIKELFDFALIEEDTAREGILSWRADAGQFQGPVRFEADLRNHASASVRLQYEMEGTNLDYQIPLDFIQPFAGGRRWYFRCPIEDIRVTKLFLPPGARRFGSRQAHSLPDHPVRAKRMKPPGA